MRYEVIPSKICEHPDGRRASPYGASPGPGFILVERGWTVRNPITGQIGIGRPPWSTREAAQAWADRAGRPSSIGLGD